MKLLFLLPIFALALRAPAADPFQAVFHEDGQAILQASAELTLYSLNPKRVHVPLFSRGPRKSQPHLFHDYPVLETVTLTGDAKDRLLGKLYTGLVEPASPARCFVPRHGIRAKSGHKQIDLVICFECQQIESYVGGKKGGGLISPSAEAFFDEMLKAKGILENP